ncbi:unnamed protein product [Trichogramma brassicae]|uniref:Uncharacterized protein n=1 Tax=Trichogramma brassicae TaxID=86971 RepID=A0A6H5HVC6_9HYME|nr:unnamed protein product [Trichogramma brassicae]
MSESGDESPESVHTDSDEESIESVHSDDDDDVSDIEIEEGDDSDQFMHTASDEDEEALTNESDLSARSLLQRESYLGKSLSMIIDESDVSFRSQSYDDESYENFFADDAPDDGNSNEHEESFDYGQKKLDTLMSLREKVNWEIEEERVEFFLLIDHRMTNWLELPELPDLRNVLQREEMDWLLAHIVSHIQYFNQGREFIEFVVRTGYKDRIDVTKEGKNPALLLRRTTAIHHAAKCRPSDWRWMVEQLFEIYDEFEVNYVDESGLTHLHVACVIDHGEVVRKFLELGQDPDLVLSETGDAPLHLALSRGHRTSVESLLRSGADPNRANEEGSTPLHIISQRKSKDDGSMKLFFEILDDVRKTVQIDAQDKRGRTPLQLAVANLKPHTVETLLDRGADPSTFVVSIERLVNDFAVQWYERADLDKLSIAAGALAIFESLEKRGYKVEDYGSIVTKIFGRLELFKYSEHLRTRDNDDWYDDEEFASRAKGITILPSIKVWTYDESSELARETDSKAMSLYDLIRLSPEAAATMFEYRHYYDWDKSFAGFPRKYEILATAHLRETMSRRCCEKIMGRLIDEEVADVCSAVTGQSPIDFII